MKLSVEALRQLGLEVFLAAGVPGETATCVVDALALSGKVNRTARPTTLRAAPAMVRVDACNGFAFPAIDAGLAETIPLARESP